MAGIDDLDAALERLGGALSGEQLEALLRRAVEPTAEHARTHVAVRTGEVREAIEVTGRHTRNTATASVEVMDSAPGGIAREAIFLEFGTSKMAAEPFLRPALAATQGDVLDNVTAGLAGALKIFE